MEIKHYAQCIRQGIVECLDQLQIVAWDDRDDTDDQILLIWLIKFGHLF